jgi:hypothetical protein
MELTWFGTLESLMDAAHTIREAVGRVTQLRLEAAAQPDLHAATTAVKAFQARRFAGTYADLLASNDYGSAARFFLEELYSDKDYSSRDAQFARIAGALQTLFPRQVVATAVSLAELHVLTEELDRQMALAWLDNVALDEASGIARYMACWAAVGRESERERQLEMVLSVGSDLDRLTRTAGLRLMLRMMRRPAMAAGLGALQGFLESGFDTFAEMSGRGARAQEFLNIVRQRESAWIKLLSRGDAVHCRGELQTCLSKAL